MMTPFLKPELSYPFRLLPKCTLFLCLLLGLLLTCSQTRADHICDLVSKGERLNLQGILHWDNSLLLVVDDTVYDLDMNDEHRQKDLNRDHTLMMYNLNPDATVSAAPVSLFLANLHQILSPHLYIQPPPDCNPDCPTNAPEPEPEPTTPEPEPETTEPEPEPTTPEPEPETAEPQPEPTSAPEAPTDVGPNVSNNLQFQQISTHLISSFLTVAEFGSKRSPSSFSQ